MIKELYKFTYRDTVYTITSADEPEMFNGDLYTCEPIGRTEILNKNEIAKENIDIMFDPQNEFAKSIANSLLEDSISLSIFKIDTSTGQRNIVMKGRVARTKRDASKITLTFETLYTSLERLGLRRKYQRSCPHVLFHRATCKLNKDDWSKFAWVVDNSLDMREFNLRIIENVAGGVIAGGMISYENNVMRFVTGQHGSKITLIRECEELANDVTATGWGNLWGGSAWHQVKIEIYPGCSRTTDDCNIKFSNLLNYGGFPFIPFKNPFGGTSIV